MMEVANKKVNFALKPSDLSVQPLSFKSIAFLEEMQRILAEDIADTDENYQSRLSFIWSFQVKEAAIMFRDSVVNLLRIEQLHKDGLKSKEELEAYQLELSEVIKLATQELQDTYFKCNERNSELNKDWEHQFNPAPEVILQVDTLIDQIKTVQRSQLKLDKLNEKFDDYRSSYLEHMEQRADSLQEIRGILQELKEKIEEEHEKVQKTSLLRIDNLLQTAMQKVESRISQAPYQFIVLEDVDKLKLAVDSTNGQMIYKSVDILSEVSGWTSFNLASPLKSIDTKVQAYKEKVLVGLIQLSNRIKAKIESSSTDEVEILRSDLTTSFNRLLLEYNEDIVPNVLEKLKELEEKLKTHIRISQLFNNEYNFLPSSAIGQLTGFAEKTDLQRRYSPERIRGAFASFFNNLFSTYTKNEQITAAGFIKNVLNFDSESDTNALFLKSGFLGSSFSVERPEILNQIDNHYSLWNDGFSGALLITGGHLTGRSTILEMLPITYPEIDSYHIVPGQKIDVNGHKRFMGDDLIETLNFILKYKGSEKCMITIDNLHYYADFPEATYDLMAALSRIIKKHSRKVYFAIVMHTYLSKKFEHYFDLEGIFTENVKTDYMPVDKIQEAVLTRAHAVINIDEHEEDSDTLASMSRKIAKKASGNIGKAMQLWCMKFNNEESIDGGFSQFRTLVENHHALLKMLVMHGWVREIQVRNMFNEIDSVRIKNSVKSLVQYKLVQRPSEGYIGINPYLVTYVESVLNRLK